MELLWAGQWFHAHEELELAWRPASGDRKLLLQALIQWAVGLEHLRRGNPRGALGQWQKCTDKLGRLPPGLLGVDVAGGRDALRRFGTRIALEQRSHRFVEGRGRPESLAGMPPLPAEETWPLPRLQGEPVETADSGSAGEAAVPPACT